MLRCGSRRAVGVLAALAVPRAAAAAAWTQRRAFFAPTCARRCAEGIDHIDIEVIAADDDTHTSPGSRAVNNANRSRDNDASSAQRSTDGFDCFPTLDMFARARVTNFVARHSAAPVSDAANEPDRRGNTASGGSLVFSMAKEDLDGAAVHRARLLLDLPAPYEPRVAVGIAPTAQDAQGAACMHAERIVDALMLPLFAMEARQKRYAEQAAAAGRRAPMPGDAPLPDAPMPPPVRIDPKATRPVGQFGAKKHTTAGFPTLRSTQPPPPPGRRRHAQEKRVQERATRVAMVERTHAAARDAPSSNASARVVSATEVLPETNTNDDDAGAEAVPTATPTATAPPTIAGKRGGKHRHRLRMDDGTPVIEMTDAPTATQLPPFRIPSQMECEEGRYRLVATVGARQCAVAHAVQTPVLLDPKALERMRLSFRMYGADFDAAVAFSEGAYDKYVFFDAKVRLPDPVSQEAVANAPAVTAHGRAMMKGTALQLCAMHAELLMDWRGVPLFPADGAPDAVALQRQHAHDAWRCGRHVGEDANRTMAAVEAAAAAAAETTANSSAGSDDSDSRIDREVARVQRMLWPQLDGAIAELRWYPADWRDQQPPLPLKELTPHHTDTHYAPYRISPMSDEELFINSHRSYVDTAAATLEVNARNIDVATTPSELPNGMCHSLLLLEGFNSVGEARLQLARYQVRHGMPPSYFNHTENSNHGRVSTAIAAPPALGMIGAFGEADSVAEAEALAVMHAVDAIFVAGLPLFDPDASPEEAALAERVTAARQALGLATHETAKELRDLTQEALNPAEELRRKESPTQRALRMASRGRLPKSARLFSPAPRSFPGRFGFRPPVRDVAEMVRLQTLSTLDFAEMDLEVATQLSAAYRNPLTHFATRASGFSQRARKQANWGSTVCRVVAPMSKGGTHCFHGLATNMSRAEQEVTTWFDLPVDPQLRHDAPDVSHPVKVAAIGRARTAKDAERLCVMHAVFLLDFYGVSMFTDAAAHDHHAQLLSTATGRSIRPFSECIQSDACGWPKEGLAAAGLQPATREASAATPLVKEPLCLPLVAAQLRAGAKQRQRGGGW